MNIIKDYVDKIFISIPKTRENQKLKSEILKKMESRYNELLKKGTSENKAYGTVISELGDIENYKTSASNTRIEEGKKILTVNEADRFLRKKKRASLLTALGIIFFMFAISSYMLIEELINKIVFSQEVQDFIEFIPLMVFIALGVLMLLLSNMMDEKCEDVKQLSTSGDVISKIEQKSKDFRNKYNISILIGIMGSVFSPVIYFSGEVIWGKTSNLPSVLCITYLSIFIFKLIYIEGVRNSYTVFIKNKKSLQERNKEKTAKFVASMVFIVSIIVYLIWSFALKAWGKSWIVFIVSGFIYLLSQRIISFAYEKEE